MSKPAGALDPGDPDELFSADSPDDIHVPDEVLPVHSEPLKFEEYLAKYGSLTYHNKGISMLPLLVQDRDLFTLVPKGNERCKKYDVILYNDRRGRYVLHRIVKVRPHDYVVLGDNTYNKEYRRDESILAVMTSFVHNGKEHSVDETGYKIYSVVWTAIYPLRKLYLKARRFGGRVLRKLHLR